MGGGTPPPIPDWKIYKVQGCTDLEWLQKSLAAKGLKDPWIRNEVWRYQNTSGMVRNAITHFGRGFKWAVGALALTILADKALGISASKKHHGDEHH